MSLWAITMRPYSDLPVSASMLLYEGPTGQLLIGDELHALSIHVHEYAGVCGFHAD